MLNLRFIQQARVAPSKDEVMFVCFKAAMMIEQSEHLNREACQPSATVKGTQEWGSKRRMRESHDALHLIYLASILQSIHISIYIPRARVIKITMQIVEPEYVTELAHCTDDIQPQPSSIVAYLLLCLACT